MESLSQLLGVAALDFAVMAAIVVFPILSLIHLRRHSPKYLSKKWLWALIIILTWPFWCIGALIYGIINFRSQLTKVGAVSIALLMCSDAFILPNSHQVDSRIILVRAYLGVDAHVVSPYKAELLDNLATLDKEILSGNISRKQQDIDRQLGVYLRSTALRGVTEAVYNEWRSLFYYRSTLDEKYMTSMIQSHFPSEVVSKPLPVVADSQMSASTLNLKRDYFAWASSMRIFFYGVAIACLMLSRRSSTPRGRKILMNCAGIIFAGMVCIDIINLSNYHSR